MAVSVLAVAGCDDSQPDRINVRSASLTVEGRGKVDVLNCYDLWQDNDGDGIPEFDLAQRQCDEQNVIPFQERRVPWRYSMIITIIRAGTVNEQVVTSTTGVLGASILPNDGIDDFINLTEYDADAPPAPVKLPESGIHFLNGRQVSRGSPIYLGAYSLTCPPCPVDLGAPNMFAGPNSFEFEVNSGDTVVVRARKQAVGAAPAFIPQDPDPLITIQAVFAIGGVPVATSGTTTSSTEDEAGFSFSFTVN